MTGERELIDTVNDKRCVRRDEKGRFDEVVDVGRSHAQDQKRQAKNESKPGIRPQLTEEQKARLPDVRHPIVRTHDDTGRKALFVNPGFTFAVEGMTEAEGTALLQELFDHMLQPEFRYTHVWQPHDFLCWDNRATMHHATLYDPKYIRHMHRTTVKGPRPV